MIFIDNKYTRIYYQIINAAQSNPRTGYTETHHIIPRSLGGTDSRDNLVSLTAREHYLCHLLLPKMLEGESKYKMLCAIIRMAHSSQEQRVKIPSRVYEQTKIAKAKMHSELYSGEKNHFYGKSHSPETIQKIKLARKKQAPMSDETRMKLSKAAKGRTLSDEHKKKLAESNKATWKDEKLRKQVSERMSGKPKSKETKQKLREACKAKASKAPKPQVQCPHCGKVGGEPSMKRWHMDNCKHK